MSTPTQIREYIKAVNPPEDNEYARHLAGYLGDNQEKFTWASPGHEESGIDAEKLYKVICEFESTRI